MDEIDEFYWFTGLSAMVLTLLGLGTGLYGDWFLAFFVGLLAGITWCAHSFISIIISLEES